MKRSQAPECAKAHSMFMQQWKKYIFHLCLHRGGKNDFETRTDMSIKAERSTEQSVRCNKKYFLKDAHCAGYEHKSKAKLLRYAKEEIVSKKSQK